MTNAQIADAFDLIGDLLEFQGANPFRVRAYRNSARTIRDYSEPLSAVVADDKTKLTDIEGIGDDLAAKIVTLVETGDLPFLQELREQVPQSVMALLRIPGVGPKKAAALHKQLGISTLDQLKAACEEHKVRELKGFGEKTEQLILAGMSLAETASLRLLWAEADTIAHSLREHFRDCPGVEQFELGGSYRRGKETVGDLDILVVAADPTAAMDRLAAFDQTKDLIGRGETKMSIRTHAGFQIDLRVVAAESFGAALQYFTGSKEHNVVVRSLAKAKGLKINEYGVFKVKGDQETYVAGKSEADVYATLGLPEFPPEMRENRREFDWAAAGDLPELITVDDIRGDLHMHTHATDGTASIEEMAAAARARGLAYIAITDHSQRVSMANGLTPARALEQWKEIDRINQDQPSGFRILKGIECDILEKGGMDLPDDVLAEADWVIASIHYGQKQPREQITDRILGAIANPYVSMVAHPTGRLLNRREAYDVDLDAVYAAAKQHGKLLELNANPMRLDLNDVHLAAAKQHGIPIVINTDAHSTDGLAVLRYGILQARRAGLTKADVANTKTWLQLKKLVGKK
ncbi:DNA polymerase/3'-5' exonuclease PolX [Anatilimnocola sp. NA78]|uniref:DNA polymerase/3'-5' exonuclease PolX n=1 Tax=Anatilimnocola sp. NA78 TaxID=3415683 RepID=UPI003CE53535